MAKYSQGMKASPTLDMRSKRKRKGKPYNLNIFNRLLRTVYDLVACSAISIPDIGELIV